MKSAPIAPEEPFRLAALWELSILDSDPEDSFDRIVRLTVGLLEVPIAMISLVDSDRQWFKSKIGLEASETPRDVSFCAHAIASDSILEVPDTRNDERFFDNPLVTNSPHIVHYTGRPIHAPGGEPVGTLCIIDHRTRTLTPVEISHLNDLADIVETELALRAETIRSRQASEIKSQFIAELSHEIRTPVSTLLGSMEILRRADHKAADYVNAMDIATTASEHIARLLNDLVDVSHIEAGQIELDESLFDVTKLVDQVTTFALNESKKKGLAFQSEIQEELPAKLIGDAARIKQILLNLITNAVRYTEVGQIQLKVSGRFIKAAESLELKVSVKDSGTGISEGEIGRIFQPFYRAKRARAMVAEGSGLGLGLALSMARLMHGTITAESDGKSGSTFNFLARLPIAKNEPHGRLSIEASGDEPRKRFLEARIMIVEDSMAIRALAEAFLQDFVNVNVFEDAESALKYAAHNWADIILMDISLPDMDGIECVKLIRQLPLHSDTRIIAFTAHAMKGDREMFLESGFNDYLPKPFTSNSLITKIRENLAS